MYRLKLWVIDTPRGFVNVKFKNLYLFFYIKSVVLLLPFVRKTNLNTDKRFMRRNNWLALACLLLNACGSNNILPGVR